MDHQCIFCSRLAIEHCCSECRKIDHTIMFDLILKKLENASANHDYYDRIKLICQRVDCMQSLMTPINFTPIIQFNPDIHKIDEEAMSYLQRTSPRIENLVPIDVAADGNCLYNSFICLSGRRDLTPCELRVRILIELIKSEVSYANQFAHIVGPLDEMIKYIARNRSFSELYEIAALTNVLGCNIQSVYPRIDYRSELDIMNHTFRCTSYNKSLPTVLIFWTNTQSELNVRRNNGGHWTPNHFVPLLCSMNYWENENGSSQSQNVNMALTPTKLTTKNNVSVQIRVPEFNAEDGSEIYQTSSITSTKTTESVVTPRTKRRLLLMESTDTSVGTQIENNRLLARERMARKRAEATPEEIERQRALARQRSAARRAEKTTEKIERDRSLARARSTARRAAFTPAEIEKERMLSRERTSEIRAVLTPEDVEKERMTSRERISSKRATRTSEEAEHERVLNRERNAVMRASYTSEEVERHRAAAALQTASQRATASPYQAEVERSASRARSAARRAEKTTEEIQRDQSLARERSAARRATRTSEEAEHERVLNRERNAVMRASYTSEEVERHRAAAALQTASQRATASPYQAEIERSASRARSAARRSALAPEERKRQQELARKRKQLKKNGSGCNEMSTEEASKATGIEWPNPIDIETKTKCLRNFIQQMSMSSLAETVCGICNVRSYKRNLHCVPFTKIPSLELLRVHDHIKHVILGVQKQSNVQWKEKFDWNKNVIAALSEHEKLTESSSQSSLYKSSFIYVNDVVFYKAGLHESPSKVKRQIFYCNICSECWSSLSNEKVPKFSPANNVWMGDIPNQLQGLTIPEQRLIALYRHNSCIVKLQSSFHSTDTAQTALKGNCISFPQDIVNISTTLPLELDDLCDSLKIIFVGSCAPQRHQLKNILTVRKNKVSEALQWLSQNNSLYRSVKINQALVDRLPDNDIPECLWANMEISTNVDAAESERSGYTLDLTINSSEDPNAMPIPIVSSAVLDVNGTAVSSTDVAEHFIQQIRAKNGSKVQKKHFEINNAQEPVYIIPRGNKPANEYSNPHLMLGIFPTLFPYGYGALEDYSRPVQVNFRDHVKYLLSYEDCRFEKHHSFMFVVFNILQRRTACFHAQLLMSRPSFQQSAQLLESLSSEEVATVLDNMSKTSYTNNTNEKMNTLMKHIKVVGGHVMGSAHARSALRTKIHSLCFNLGLPSLFVTINPADIHSPVALYFAGVDLDLDKIIPEKLGTSYERAQIIAKHPVANAKFFNCLIRSILKSLVLGGVLGPVRAYFGTVENQGRGSLHLHLLIWLNHDFTPAQLKQQIQKQEFRENLVKYLEDIVKEDLDLFRGKAADDILSCDL